jgi:hypothetical protein
LCYQNAVIPAQAGIQLKNQSAFLIYWIPACAGMTGVEYCWKQLLTAILAV